MKVLEINNDFKTAIAEVSGFKKKIRTDLLEDVKVGDYVIVHAGFAIQKLNEKEAKETIELLQQMFSAED